MKRFITSIVAMVAIVSANAMSYSQAREQAWFLTDKMAYELYLNAAQMEAVYEINLDYIMNVDAMGDIFGIYWERRTRELSFVLSNSQMHTFLASEYFYRPISWVNSSFYFTVYDRYPKARFYRSAPRVYTTYRGEFRHNTNSRFEGRFTDNKPVTTGRTLSTRTGVSTTSTSKGGFTNPGNGSVTNGRTKPSATGTSNMGGGSNKGNTGFTNPGNKGGDSGKTKPSVTSSRTDTKVVDKGSTRTTTVTRTEVSKSTATMGSSRTTTSSNRTTTVNGSNRTSGAASSSARRH